MNLNDQSVRPRLRPSPSAPRCATRERVVALPATGRAGGNRRSLRLRTACIALLIASAISPFGCQQQKRSAEQPEPGLNETAEHAPIRHGTVARPEVVPADVNTADKAARVVATLPSVEDPWTRREIRLHEALYREAFRGRVDDVDRPVLLQPMPASDLPELSIGEREFYLRVLAAMNDLPVPAAWTTVEPAVEAEFFPGSRNLATRLSFEVLQRNETEATVMAEVSDTTAHVGSSQQRVVATWDGLNWITEREGARLMW